MVGMDKCGELIDPAFIRSDDENSDEKEATEIKKSFVRDYDAIAIVLALRFTEHLELALTLRRAKNFSIDQLVTEDIRSLIRSLIKDNFAREVSVGPITQLEMEHVQHLKEVFRAAGLSAKEGILRLDIKDYVEQHGLNGAKIAAAPESPRHQ